MLESPEQIQCTLELAGEPIVFPAIATTDVNNVVTIVREAFTINAIPGQVVYTVQDYSSPADLSKREIIFRVSASNYITKVIVLDDIFEYIPSTSPTRKSVFKVISSYDDLTGWIAMYVELQEVTDVV